MNLMAYLLAFFSLIAGCLLFARLKWPYSYFLLLFPQLLIGALSPLLALIGVAGAFLGWLVDAPLAIVAGLTGAVLLAIYIRKVTAPQAGFERAFGADWSRKISLPQTRTMLRRRWTPWLQHKGNPQWERDIAFWSVPPGDRKLLCDLWLPPSEVARTGEVFVYFHGSSWSMFDKDFGTRPFFRHLTSQGHVVMDVAYRLCPEVDIYGMIGDVKRAIAWIKTNARKYDADPERVVVGGASAGGQLALLAAYAPLLPQLTPEDVSGCDLNVRGVVSYYGPADLGAVYAYTNQSKLIGLPRVIIGQPVPAGRNNGARYAGRLDVLLGGHLNEIPAVYELASPITHVHPNCPPTLLIHGAQDVAIPVSSTRALYHNLVKAGVPVVMLIYPQTNHAFDLLFPQVSPPAQAALFELDRFLMLMQ